MRIKWKAENRIVEMTSTTLCCSDIVLVCALIRGTMPTGWEVRLRLDPDSGKARAGVSSRIYRRGYP